MDPILTFVAGFAAGGFIVGVYACWELNRLAEAIRRNLV